MIKITLSSGTRGRSIVFLGLLFLDMLTVHMHLNENMKTILLIKLDQLYHCDIHFGASGRPVRLFLDWSQLDAMKMILFRENHFQRTQLHWLVLWSYSLGTCVNDKTLRYEKWRLVRVENASSNALNESQFLYDRRSSVICLFQWASSFRSLAETAAASCTVSSQKRKKERKKEKMIPLIAGQPSPSAWHELLLLHHLISHTKESSRQMSCKE